MKSIEEQIEAKRYECPAIACSMQEGTYPDKTCEFVTSKDYDRAIKERDDARAEAKYWRHKSFGEPTSKVIVENMIRENPLPWEKVR